MWSVRAMTESMHPLVELAASRERQSSTSATPEQVEIVGDLEALSRALVDHTRMVLMGEAVDWAQIADQLAALETRCRRQVRVRLTDIGDSGGQ